MNTKETGRGRRSIQLDLMLSSLIFILGASSLTVSALSKIQENFLMEFRYMTVNGTLFTTLISFIIILVKLAELRTGKNKQQKTLYYFRLCAAVTECIIGVVILLSFFPFVPDDPSLLSYESFTMHVVLPVLSVISFLVNEAPVDYAHPVLRLNCAWLITLYAAVVITLIITGLIPREKIPYSFLDFQTRPAGYMIYFGLFIYSFTYVLSVLLTEGNKKLWRFRTQKADPQSAANRL